MLKNHLMLLDDKSLILNYWTLNKKHQIIYRVTVGGNSTYHITKVCVWVLYHFAMTTLDTVESLNLVGANFCELLKFYRLVGEKNMTLLP